jgi:hypothetical protein
MNREATKMDFFVDKRLLMSHSTKRSLWLLLLCTSALVVYAQQGGSASGNNPKNTPAITLQLNGQPTDSELNLFFSSNKQATIFLVPTGTLPKRQYTITAVNFPVTVTVQEKQPAAQGAASTSITSYLGTDLTNAPSPSPSPTASPGASPSPGPSPAASPSPTPRAATIFPFILSADVLPQPGDQYTGTLLVTSEGASPLKWKINIKPPNAILVLDTPKVSQSFTFWPWGTQSDLINVNIREKTGRLALEGVSASLVDVIKDPGQGFDLNKNVDFSFNGTAIDKFTQSPLPNDASRTIPSNNGLGTIGLLLHGLSAGEYNVVVRFQSTNSSNDDAKLTLNLQVRHHWLWPLLALLAAIILSFVLTKIVNSRRQRILFMKRIEDLEPSWLRDEPQLLPVVWAQAALKQSQDLSKRFWLTGEDQIEARVAHVEALMDILGKIRLLRNDVQNSSLRKYQKYRAIAKLNGVLSSIGTASIDDVMAKELEISLSSLRQWLDVASESKFYWQDFRGSVQYLLGEVDPNFSNPMYQSLESVVQEQQLNTQAIREIEHQYILLKLLWEQRKNLSQELQNLKKEAEEQLGAKGDQPVVQPAQPEEQKQSTEEQKPEATAAPQGPGSPTVKALRLSKVQADIFALADQQTWDRLKNKLEIKMPMVDDINRLEAYTPAYFSIETPDKSLAETYVFRHGLRFKWTLTFVSGKRKAAEAPIPEELQKPKPPEVKPQETKPQQTKSEGTQPQETEERRQRKPGKRHTMTLNPVTEEPQVIQYFPTEGQVWVSVEISWSGDLENPVRLPKEGEMGPLTVSPSRDFGMFNDLEKVQYISFGAAGLAAITTGVMTFYVNHPGFGSLSDYLTLFAWGAGFDQGKNFLQNLQAPEK